MNKFFGKFWQGAVIASLAAAPAAMAQVAIYMCGDSTMQDWAEGYYPKQGQGQDFHYWFDSGLATVINRGQGGMAADGYYDMFWKQGCSAGNCIVSKLKAGDYAVIQFGINDVSKSDEAKFTVAMSNMVKETKAKGAYPIIMSPIRRLYYDSPTAIHNSYRGYPARAKAIADSLDVPFIDMSEMVANYMISVGENYAAQFIFNYASTAEYSNLKSSQTDQVHLQMNGANAFGRIITEQMRAHSDPMTKKLGSYMAPMYQVDVKVSPVGAAQATSLGAYYPEGMTVMLKTIPNAGYTFVGWYDGNGNKVSGNAISTVKSPYIHTFKMGNKATQYTAVYQGGSAVKYTGDGKALTSFPTTTPKSLDDVTFVPYTPVGGSDTSGVQVDKSIKKFFDAYLPDSTPTKPNGFSESNWAHTGDGFFNFANEKNSSATYRMRFPGAGYVTLAVRYANGGTTDRMFNAYLDHDYYLNAPPTGGWDKWDTAYVVMDAPLGEADLKFISLTNDGAPNIDAFGFSIDDVCRVSDAACIAEVIAKENAAADTSKQDSADTTKNDSAKVDTVPAFVNANLNLPQLSEGVVAVFDMHGKLVAKRQMVVGSRISSEDLNEMVRSNGVYHVVIRKGSQIIHQTMAKTK